jgi:choline dehydrogenase-like flavoprotein
MGTCAMKPREEGGVVDARLNVYGVEGLKVAGMGCRIIPDSYSRLPTWQTCRSARPTLEMYVTHSHEVLIICLEVVG